MTLAKASEPLVIYKPKNALQVATNEIWSSARLIFLVGQAGTGKTTAALGQSLLDVVNGKSACVMLSRPTVSAGEESGFLPGSLTEKLGPWLAPFHDVMGDLSTAKLEALKEKVQTAPVGMLRGRTVANCTLIIDEAQNLSWPQIVMAATRVGRGGRVVLCGDPDQTDLTIRKGEMVPLIAAARKLEKVEGVVVIQATKADQVRDKFVNAVIEALSDR